MGRSGSTVAIPLPASAADHGYAAWTTDPLSASVATPILTNGLMYVARLKLAAAATVSTVSVYVTTGGTTLTSGQSRLALFDASRVLLATSADQSAAWATAGLKAAAVTPQALPAGYCFVGLWANGVALPTLACGTSLAAGLVNAGLSAPNLRFATADTGLTTTAPGTVGAMTAAAASIWVALG